MAHLTGSVFTSIKEALVYDLNLQNEQVDEDVSSIEHYELGISDAVISSLENCYGSLYSLYQFLELQGLAQHDIHSWVLYRNKKLSSVLLFKVIGSHVRVITEMMSINELDLNKFTQSIFDRYKNIKFIILNAVDLPQILPQYPYQKFICTENFIIDLPSNREQYFLGLGRSTRKAIKSSSNKFRKDFTDFLLRVCEARDISPTAQQTIFKKLQLYKQASMLTRDKAMVIDEDENQRLFMLVAERGVFVLVMIDGEIRAGTVSCKVGSNMVMIMSAADPELSAYRLGFLVNYWAIGDCIERGIQQCHLLWGRYYYKTQLGAQAHDLVRAVFYRSNAAMYFSPLTAMSMVQKNISMQCRNWLVYKCHRNPNKWMQHLSRFLLFMRSIWLMLKL